MLNPPFKLANSPEANEPGGGDLRPAPCCDASASHEAGTVNRRSRLADLDVHFHCSVIGTCLSTAELRKLMGRFLLVSELSDLEVHHEAVNFSSSGSAVTKAVQKALDPRGVAA